MSYIPPHLLVKSSDDSFGLLAGTLAKQALVNKDWNAIVQPKLDSLKTEFLQAVLPGLDIDACVSSSGLAFLLKNAYDEAAFVPSRVFTREVMPSTTHFLKKGLAQLSVTRTPVLWYAWACLYLTYLIQEPGETRVNEVFNIKYQAAKHHAKVPAHLWRRLQSSACDLLDDL